MSSWKVSRSEELQIEQVVQDLYEQGHPQLAAAYTALAVKENLLAIAPNSLTVRQAAQLKLVALYLLRNKLVQIPRNQSERRLPGKHQELLGRLERSPQRRLPNTQREKSSRPEETLRQRIARVNTKKAENPAFSEQRSLPKLVPVASQKHGFLYK